jgi:hypothetical protein
MFVKDLRTGAITRANVGEDGIEPKGASFSPSLSANGRVITFLTNDPTLLEVQPGDVDGPGDTVVVTEVNFPAPPADIPGAPPGAPSIEILPILILPISDSFGSGFALRSTIERPGDQDWFRVALVEGARYTIDLEGRPTGPAGQGTLDDPLLRILVPKIPGVDLDLEQQDDDCGVGLNARLVFEARATGDYFISAEAFGAATGTYRLLVRTPETGEPDCLD